MAISPIHSSVPPEPLPVGDGLLGRYFADKHLIDLQRTQVDSSIHFDWASGAPPSLPADGFSIRWTGFVTPLYSEDYIFYTVSDDGVRLWVDQKQLINHWVDQTRTEKKGTIALKAGRRYPIRLDYYEHRGEALISLLWSSPSQSKVVIPQSQLFSK